MKRLLMAVGASLALAGCGLPAPDIADLPAAPLAATEADERAIAYAFASAETLTAAVNVLREAGHPCCRAGTPAARANADRLDRLAAALEAASAAQRLGNAGLAGLKYDEAAALLAAIGAAMKGDER